jgi:hypothetical protein
MQRHLDRLHQQLDRFGIDWIGYLLLTGSINNIWREFKIALAAPMKIKMSLISDEPYEY